MKLDPTKLSDWQIAEAAETELKPVSALAAELGIRPEELSPYGRCYGKVDAQSVIGRLGDGAPRAKYVDVTAMTPTPLGEGKTTTTMGLVEGLGALGRHPVAAIRQPSGGPTFNIKGSAAGGGLAQCLPLAPLSLGLTGDETVTIKGLATVKPRQTLEAAGAWRVIPDLTGLVPLLRAEGMI